MDKRYKLSGDLGRFIALVNDEDGNTNEPLASRMVALRRWALHEIEWLGRKQ
jgi:hypothetical protein